jgi:hypothetical protein
MTRTILFGITILLGLSLGLYYGWVLNPVLVVDTAPEILREDFQADYVLMVAEIFQSEQNAELALQRLEFLGAENPLNSTTAALDFAAKSGLSNADFDYLDALDKALRKWDPSLEITPTP